jgi:hypothetical protein
VTFCLPKISQVRHQKIFLQSFICLWTMNAHEVANFLPSRCISETLHSDIPLFFVMLGDHGLQKAIENFVVVFSRQRALGIADKRTGSCILDRF